jgi:hypothetical protein
MVTVLEGLKISDRIATFLVKISTGYLLSMKQNTINNSATLATKRKLNILAKWLALLLHIPLSKG